MACGALKMPKRLLEVLEDFFLSFRVALDAHIQVSYLDQVCDDIWADLLDELWEAKPSAYDGEPIDTHLLGRKALSCQSSNQLG